MKYLVLDIETAPIDVDELPHSVISYLVERKSEGRFHPIFSRVIAVGIKMEGVPPKCLLLPDFENDERQLLIAFWDIVREERPGRFVTYNGMEFDAPFLIIRSIVNSVRGVAIDTNPWRVQDGNHFDCLLALQGMGRQFSSVSLPIACQILGVQVPREYHDLTGRGIADAYRRGQWEEIRQHCVHDVLLTEQLYLRILPFLPEQLPDPGNGFATEKQIAYIRTLAYERGLSEAEVEKLVPPGLTKEEASATIELLRDRRQSRRRTTSVVQGTP